MIEHIAAEPRPWDHARPLLTPARHARAAADRFCDRYGRPRPRWAMWERMVRKERHAIREGIAPTWTADELLEIRLFAPMFGKSEPWVRAVRLIRRSRTRAMWAVALRAVVAPREVRRGR